MLKSVKRCSVCDRIGILKGCLQHPHHTRCNFKGKCVRCNLDNPEIGYFLLGSNLGSLKRDFALNLKFIKDTTLTQLILHRTDFLHDHEKIFVQGLIEKDPDIKISSFITYLDWCIENKIVCLGIKEIKKVIEIFPKLHKTKILNNKYCEYLSSSKYTPLYITL